MFEDPRPSTKYVSSQSGPWAKQVPWSRLILRHNTCENLLYYPPALCCFSLFSSVRATQRKGTAKSFSQKTPQSEADIWALHHSNISPPCVSHPASLLNVFAQSMGTRRGSQKVWQDHDM